MNVVRDDLEDHIKNLEDKLEKTREMKKMRDVLINGIREILDKDLPLDGNSNETNDREVYTFNVKANDYEIEIKIIGGIK